MKKKILIIAICIFLMVCLYNLPGHTGSCVLCNSCPYHEPCIISLATGDIIPLTVYDPHPFKAGELAEEQTDGYASLIHYQGFSGYRDTNSRKTIGKIQMSSTVPLRRAFCPPCHKKLSKFSQIGFVVTDLQNPINPIFFSLEDEVKLTLRCYEITATLESGRKTYWISVQGTQ